MNLNATTIAARLVGIQVTKDPQKSAEAGYPNPGTDLRIVGDFGRALARIQQSGSFKSSTPPVLGAVERFGRDVYLQTATAPNGQRHVTWAARQPNGKWTVVRVGPRYDPNWGDENSIGWDPDRSIRGGYIWDIVIKFNQDRSHIDGVV